MNEQQFLDWCKKEVVKYTNSHLDKSDKKEITKDDGQQVIVPDCKECIYAIEEGIEGCELDNQTMRIKIGMDKCEFKEAK